MFNIYRTVGMKTNLAIIIFFAFAYCAFSQTLSGPESVVYDKINKRYLVSNAYSGHILSTSGYGEYDYFLGPVDGLNSPKGMTIVDTALYVVDVTKLWAFDLRDASILFEGSVPGAQFLNGVCADSSGNLYLTDTQQSQIFSFNVESYAFSTIENGGAIASPNGIMYDAEDNRLIFVGFVPNSPIRAFDLTTNNHILIRETTISYMDGITKDQRGNYYISHWEHIPAGPVGKVFKFNPNFDGVPAEIMKNLISPAGIFYNVLNDTLAIPYMESDSVMFLDLRQPDKPVLIAPENGATDQPLHPTLKWERIENAVSYVVNVALDMAFQTGLITMSVPATSLQDTVVIGQKLNPNTKYYWKLKAKNIGGFGPESEVWEFETGEDDPHSVENKERNNASYCKIFPHPVTSEATIRIKMSGTSKIEVGLFDASLRKLADIQTCEFISDICEVRFDASKYESGIYFIGITNGVETINRKFILIK